MRCFNKSSSFNLLIVCALMAFATQAHALLIDPESGILNVTRWEGDQTSQGEIDDVLTGILGFDPESDLLPLYKNNVPVTEEGPLAGRYQTTYYNTPEEPSDADIEYMGGEIVGPTAFLLVKDHEHIPAWYFFNLTALGWNGTEMLELEDFWPNGGSISYVALYGTSGTSAPTPEPATMLLFCAGLIGFAGFRKKFRK